jgi:hypothetical protein
MASYFEINKSLFERMHLHAIPHHVIKTLFVSLILFLSQPAFSQKTDSVLQRVNEIEGASQLNSLTKVNTDSLKLKIKLDSVSNRLNNSIDSISNMKLPQGKYYRKLDSLFKSTQASLNVKLGSNADSLNSKTNETIKRYQAKLESRMQRIDSLNKKFKLDLDLKQPDADVSFNPGELKMAGVDTPEFNKPDVPGFSLPNLATSTLGIPAVDNLKEKLGQVKEVSGDAKKYAGKAEELKSKDVKDELKEEVKNLPEELEKQAVKIDEVKALKRELPQTSDVTDQFGDIKSKATEAGEIKGEVKNLAKKTFVDHFAGKEEVVKSGISQLEKYQKKYNSVKDIRYLPKKRPNNMKGKPFIERVTPGVTFQVFAQEGDWKGIDISPSAEYNFNDHFRAGFSAGYRININSKSLEVDDRDKTYIFRSLVNYKLGKGFFAHLDAEAMRTKECLVNKSSSPADLNIRVWDYSLNVGIFKSYRINKNTSGTMVLLYDLTKMEQTFNVSQIGIRFGMEFKLKKKKLPQTTNSIESTSK